MRRVFSLVEFGIVVSIFAIAIVLLIPGSLIFPRSVTPSKVVEDNLGEEWAEAIGLDRPALVEFRRSISLDVGKTFKQGEVWVLRDANESGIFVGRGSSSLFHVPFSAIDAGEVLLITPEKGGYDEKYELASGN